MILIYLCIVVRFIKWEAWIFHVIISETMMVQENNVICMLTLIMQQLIRVYHL